MSINFATLQGLTIPEGVVTEIKDASGMVLWSAVKPVTITVKYDGGQRAEIRIAGDSSVLQTGTYEVPAGTVLSLWVEGATSSATASIKVNGVTVAECTDDDTTYNYTVTEDAYISATSMMDEYGLITITET